MSILHVFVIADAHGWNTTTQLRSHEAIPWDEAYDLYLDQSHLNALVTLARAAMGDERKLRGRVFDVLRAVEAARIPREFHRRDAGPFAVVTPSSVLHRIELEEYISRMTEEQMNDARAFALRLDRLTIE